MKTRVSIVIPTRHRPHLLAHALRSALSQTHADVQVVVSDNGRDRNSEAVVAALADGRVTYVPTGRDLCMADNWEFALQHATGEYITYLTDDAYLFPFCIERALADVQCAGARLAVWRHCAYFASDWVEPARRNIAYVPKSSGRARVISSRDSLRLLFGRLDESGAPKTLNSLCHRSVIERAVARQGRFFLEPAPDYTSCVGMLANVEEYVAIDAALYADGVTRASIGAATHFDAAAAAQFVQEHTSTLDDLAFLGIPTSVCFVARCLECMAALYADRCPPIGWDAVVLQVVDAVVKMQANHVDTSQYWTALDDYVRDRVPYLRRAVDRQKVISTIKWAVTSTLRRHAALERLETLRNIRIVRGQDWGFNNIEDCARVVLQHGLVTA